VFENEWGSSSMVLTLQIDKLTSGVYRAALLSDGTEVTTTGEYSSIEDAIREEFSEVPSDFAHFAEVRYGGVSSGTMAIARLPQEATEVGDRLVATLAEMHRLAGR
jgi:hypothetical protein